METTRRKLFQILGSSLLIDWDRFLWVPGEKHIVIPSIILPCGVSGCFSCRDNAGYLRQKPKTPFTLENPYDPAHLYLLTQAGRRFNFKKAKPKDMWKSPVRLFIDV